MLTNAFVVVLFSNATISIFIAFEAATNLFDYDKELIDTYMYIFLFIKHANILTSNTCGGSVQIPVVRVVYGCLLPAKKSHFSATCEINDTNDNAYVIYCFLSISFPRSPSQVA